jgi:pimeloyl-ACP methyl ester carboxylesterase
MVVRRDGAAIAVDVVGDENGIPVLFCHGLADCRLSAHLFGAVASALGLAVVAPDRPGIGESDLRPLTRLADWAEDARAVLDALRVPSAALLGISGGGPFAAASAAMLAERVHALLLVSPLGDPSWGTSGMAAGERLSLAVARRAPSFGGWFLGRLAVLARRSPALFLPIATSELPDVDRRALARPAARDAFVAGYVEAFRRGSRGVAQDLRLLTRPWGFDLAAIRCPTWIHHGEADTTVPAGHARGFAAAVDGAHLQIHPGHGHFSLLPDTARAVLAPLVQ